jgi:hypothetical protein
VPLRLGADLHRASPAELYCPTQFLVAPNLILTDKTSVCDRAGQLLERPGRRPALMIAPNAIAGGSSPAVEVFSRRYERGSIIVTTSGESGIATASGRRTDRHPASRSPCGRRFRLTERR